MKADTVLTLTPLDINGKPLTPFHFTRYEVPEKISFGGDQMLAVHQFIGGARVIDAMGRSDIPLAWSGLFFGSSALVRARYIDYLRTNGGACLLTWAELSYKVVIQTFKADFERFYQLPYSITCVVVADNAKQQLTAPASIDQSIGDDINLASSLTSLIGDGPLSSAMATLSTAVKAVSSFAAATRATLNTVLAPLAIVYSQTQSLIATASNTIQSVTTLGGILPYNPIATQAQNLLGQVTAMNSLPQLFQLQSVLSRVGTNISGISTAGQTVTVGGGNLFKMAQQNYGDATNWTDIAKANALVDPQITGVQTLSIPSVPGASGGVLSQ
ncbi:MAG: hypothetical protein KGI54_13655 [Pseudomonadota bacterium]|nr:hypothetical protein [Pseudomonadota bacterium]